MDRRERALSRGTVGRSTEENLGVVLMRTTVRAEGVFYEVVAPGGVVHSEFVHFSKRRGHGPGGIAFVKAANRQERRAFDTERQERAERRYWLEVPPEIGGLA
jgi:hypothetical protein